VSGGRLFKRVGKVIAYRAVAGAPGGFIASNPQYFDKLSNATEITDLRFQFEIEKSVDSEPNTCKLTITNCQETTRVNLETKPLTVQILAGYDDAPRYLFTGDLRHGWSELDGTEWLTHLQLADGDRAFRYAQIARSYRKGSSVITALQECAQTMGLKLDAHALASPDLQAQFASGRTLQGDTRDELSRLLAPYGYRWSIQSGQLQILRDGDTLPGQAILVNESTGMIGSPQFATPDKAGKAPTLHVKMLLYPELTPGGTIKVESRSINGIFRIERVTHTGGTFDDDDWMSEIEAKPA
jgi:hypothetical protein